MMKGGRPHPMTCSKPPNMSQTQQHISGWVISQWWTSSLSARGLLCAIVTCLRRPKARDVLERLTTVGAPPPPQSFA